MSLLLGVSFTLFYTFLGLPMLGLLAHLRAQGLAPQ